MLLKEMNDGDVFQIWCGAGNGLTAQVKLVLPDVVILIQDGFEVKLPGDTDTEAALSSVEDRWLKSRMIADKSLHQQRVERFMMLAGQKVRFNPLTDSPSDEERLLAARLLLEEVFETIEKGLGIDVWEDQTEALGFRLEIKRPFDLVETVDGCVDVSVVNTRILSVIGVPDLPVQQMVDENNLQKFGPGSSRRPDGKLVKPKNHEPPKIKEWIDLFFVGR